MDRRASGKFWRDFLIVLGLLLICAAIFIPGIPHDRGRAKRTACLQSLGTWRKVMEFYASEHEKGWFPKELSGRRGESSDEKLISTLAKYVNITNTLRDCDTVFSYVTTEGFTIMARAKDRNNTILTATPDEVIQP